jgi:hypothetical protein
VQEFWQNMLCSLHVWTIDRREVIEKVGGSVVTEEVRQFRILYFVDRAS